MQKRARKALGCLVLLAYLAIYAALAAALGGYLVQILPWWGQLIYFAAAGVLWVLPLKPLFGWMNRGG